MCVCVNLICDQLSHKEWTEIRQLGTLEREVIQEYSKEASIYTKRHPPR